MSSAPLSERPCFSLQLADSQHSSNTNGLNSSVWSRAPWASPQTAAQVLQHAPHPRLASKAAPSMLVLVAGFRHGPGASVPILDSPGRRHAERKPHLLPWVLGKPLNHVLELPARQQPRAQSLLGLKGGMQQVAWAGKGFHITEGTGLGGREQVFLPSWGASRRLAAEGCLEKVVRELPKILTW